MSPCKRAAIIALLGMAVLPGARSQELFVYNEPASNMPAHTLGLRLTNMLYENERQTTTMLAPELMWGASKRLMLHGELYTNTMEGRYNIAGTGAYAKYRFYSNDKVHRHFRMAAFGRISSNNLPARQEELETSGQNAGWQAGVIATQLQNKTALSMTTYYEAATAPTGIGEQMAHHRYALNYRLSAGRLMLPAHYTSYRQTNLNLMAEVMAQQQPGSGKYYLDVAPSAQLIINSQTRIDAGYRWQLAGSMNRTARNSLLIRVEHLFFLN